MGNSITSLVSKSRTSSKDVSKPKFSNSDLPSLSITPVFLSNKDTSVSENRLSMCHHTLSDLTPISTLTSPSDHHSVAVVQDVSRERTPKRARAVAETNPTKRRPIITVLILNKYQNGIKKKKI